MRRFELPALASWETRHAVDALDALARATGEARWCAPVLAAAAWLRSAAIRPGCWARFYGLDDGQPLFFDADGTRVVAPAEAQPGYDWQGDFGIAALLRRVGMGEGDVTPAPLPGIEHKLGLPDIQAVIGAMEPLDEALDFLDWLRSRTQVVILSDTFAEFAVPLMRKLAWPTLFCHALEVDGGGRITGYRLRQPDGKRRAVEALRGLNFRVVAAGDSYNDTTMLEAADRRHPVSPAAERHRRLPPVPGHAHLRRAARGAGAGLGRRARPLTRRHRRKIAGRLRPIRQATNDAITQSVLSP